MLISIFFVGLFQHNRTVVILQWFCFRSTYCAYHPVNTKIVKKNHFIFPGPVASPEGRYCLKNVCHRHFASGSGSEFGPNGVQTLNNMLSKLTLGSVDGITEDGQIQHLFAEESCEYLEAKDSEKKKGEKKG
jgi:hypothetical protein